MSRCQDFDFMMPAEWSPTEAVWLSWPVAPHLWEGVEREIVENEFVRLAEVIGRFATVRISVCQEERDRVASLLKNAEVFAIATDDVWCRDHGPTFLKSPKTGEVALVDWTYNAWGGKFAYEKDARVASAIGAQLALRTFASKLVCEGGALESNGAGRILTTESVLLNPNRNPDWSKEEVSAELLAKLGAHEVIWLRAGLENDDTDGHVDMVARFVGEQKVLAVESATSNLVDNWQKLEDAGLEVVALPFVGEIAEGIEGSYANFLIVNDGVVAPQYGLSTDSQALEIISRAFPEKQVVGFDCRILGLEGGGAHCLTQGQWA
ncbi:agmatine deiminase family protein [Roseibacillus persicicus]